MTEFFHKLTIRNWGWAYHVILSGFGFAVGAIALMAMSVQPTGAFFLSGLGVNLIGLIYELFQQGDFQGTLEDVVGNVLGCSLTFLIMQGTLWVTGATVTLFIQ